MERLWKYLEPPAPEGMIWLLFPHHQIDDAVMRSCRKHLRSACGDCMDNYDGHNYKVGTSTMDYKHLPQIH